MLIMQKYTIKIFDPNMLYFKYYFIGLSLLVLEMFLRMQHFIFIPAFWPCVFFKRKD